MAQGHTTDSAADASEYDYDADYTLDSADEAVDFTDAALGNIETHLKENLGTARGMDKANDSDSVGKALDPDNVHQIQIRARPLENPKVTVWLKDCPIWANDSWRDYIYPNGTNAYNGKVTLTFDVRPW